MWGAIIYGAIGALYALRCYFRTNDPAVRALIARECPADRRIHPVAAALIVAIAWPYFMMTRGRRIG